MALLSGARRPSGSYPECRASQSCQGINGALGRHGRVWSDRYHARALATPREVRNALVYVLQNFRWMARRRGGRRLGVAGTAAT
jgi:hypothetical protein